MKKFITKIAIVFVLFISINSILFYLLSRDSWISEIEKTQDNNLKKKINNKIIVAAGSSMKNSFDSELASKELKREVFNASLTLAHKATFILNYITDNINKGDVFIYGPEFDHYYDDDQNISTPQIISIYNNPKLFKYQSEKQKLNFIYNIPKTNILLTYRKIKTILKPSLFKKTNYNDRGDYIDHLKDKKTWKPKKENRYNRNHFNHNLSKRFKERLILTKNKVEKKGGSFYVTFPPHPISEYDDRLKEDILPFLTDNDINFIGEPDTFVFNDSLFLNHPYHTTFSGTKKRTLLFINLFKPIIGIQYTE